MKKVITIFLFNCMFFCVHFLFLTAASSDSMYYSKSIYNSTRTITRTVERLPTTITGLNLIELFNLDRLNDDNPNRSYSIRLLNEDRVVVNDTNFTDLQGVIVLRLHSRINYDVLRRYNVFHIYTDDFGNVTKFELNHQVEDSILIKVAFNELDNSLREPEFRGGLLAKELSLNIEELPISAIDFINYFARLKDLEEEEQKILQPDGLIGKSFLSFNFPGDHEVISSTAVRLFDSNEVEVIFHLINSYNFRTGIYLNLKNTESMNYDNIIRISLDNFGRIKEIHKGIVDFKFSRVATDASIQRTLSLLSEHLEG